eukprot:14302-Pelagococcus_subviridis.AAC.3
MAGVSPSSTPPIWDAEKAPRRDAADAREEDERATRRHAEAVTSRAHATRACGIARRARASDESDDVDLTRTRLVLSTFPRVDDATSSLRFARAAAARTLAIPMVSAEPLVPVTTTVWGMEYSVHGARAPVAVAGDGRTCCRYPSAFSFSATSTLSRRSPHPLPSPLSSQRARSGTRPRRRRCSPVWTSPTSSSSRRARRPRWTS